MIYCEDCGFKGSKYLDDNPLPFSDVSQDAWYYAYVQTAYNFGIINGKSETIFDPNAGLTCAEAAKIAAVIHNQKRYDGEKAEFQMLGENWYDVYVQYCYDNAYLKITLFSTGTQTQLVRRWHICFHGAIGNGVL